MYDAPGFVVEASTHQARLKEIAKWEGHPWWMPLVRLNFLLSKIDTAYTLVQFKEKFGSPRFYFSTSSGRRQEMQRLVDAAYTEMEKAEQYRKTFDRYAVPPSD